MSTPPICSRRETTLLLLYGAMGTDHRSTRSSVFFLKRSKAKSELVKVIVFKSVSQSLKKAGF